MGDSTDSLSNEPIWFGRKGDLFLMICEFRKCFYVCMCACVYVVPKQREIAVNYYEQK